MAKETIKTLSERLTAKGGIFRAPAWWMRRLFGMIADEIDKLSSNISHVRQNQEKTIKMFYFEYASKGQIKIKYGDKYIQTLGKTSTEPEKVYFYGNLIIPYGRVVDEYSEYNITYLDFTACGDWENGIRRFEELTSLQTLKLPYSFAIDTDGADRSRVFYSCSSLSTLEIGGIENLVKPICKTTEDMFYCCQKLTALDLSGWGVQNVTNMSGMFHGCDALASLETRGWNVENVADMSYMFHGCSSLTTLEINGWNVQNATDMSSMFYDCEKITVLNLQGWNVQNVTNMSYMFSSCYALTTLELGGWKVHNVANMLFMFGYCRSLTTITGPITGINCDLDLHYCPLTTDSAMVFINGLAQVTSKRTLTLKSSTYSLLTAEQIAIATSKGWTVASSN